MDTVVQNYLEQFGVREETRRFVSRAQKMLIGGAGCRKATGNRTR